MANLGILIENITPTDIVINDLGLVLVSGAFIDLDLYCATEEIIKSLNIIPYIENGNILVYTNEAKTNGALGVENAKKHLSLQSELIDHLDETALLELDIRLDNVESQLQSVLIDAGVEIVLSSLSNGTNTYTLTKICKRILVSIDGILQYDYTQPNETDQLVLGFIPREDSYVYAYSFRPSVDGTATSGNTGGANSLIDLLDIDFSIAPTNGQALAYDSTTQKLKPTTISSGEGNGILDGGTF